jgi:hypothetical protein
MQERRLRLILIGLGVLAGVLALEVLVMGEDSLLLLVVLF